MSPRRSAFVGQGGSEWASLVSRCLQLKPPPLEDVFTKLPTATNWQIKDLTPAAWAAAKTGQRQRAAA